MFSPGDVVEFYSVVAGKNKYHVSLSLEGCFFLLNSPKIRVYPGDFIFPCSEVPFLPPTSNGDSIVSCSIVIRMTDAQLLAARARRIGSISTAVLTDLMTFVENSTVLSQEDKDAVLDGLGSWC